ncbi:MAG: uracil-DNA glycosylase [Acidobacteria bacterium]|nr:MAG: uracil-DNA glycosylase [Acidobacteriota bacterium]
MTSGDELARLAAEASGCTACGLAETRTQVVFGSGNPHSRVMFVGEAPGMHEDEQGVPFVGRAGKLLDTLLGEVGLARQDVYIANVLKCRPPNNRDPRPDEIESCGHFLRGQIDVIEPRVICTLGNFATQLLLKRQVGITRLRGQQFPFRGGSVLIPTYHPAALLRGGRTNLMAESRSDFALIAEIAASAMEGDSTDNDESATQMELF